MKTIPLLLALALAVPAFAEVKLSTLPDRESALIRFEDNGRVLVEELRTLTLAQGANTLDFTWLGVEVERGSIQLLPVGGVGFEVIRTTWPPGQGNSLRWEVTATKAGAAQVRVSYLVAGMAREISYRAVLAEGGAPRLALRAWQRLNNASGESYDAAALKAAFGDLRNSPLATGEIRQQLTARFDEVPFAKRYTYDPQQGERVRVDYVLVNAADQGLGRGLLPAGKVRVFQAQGGSEAFLGEDQAQPVPLGEELKLHIGDSKDLTVRRAVLENRQEVQQRDVSNRPSRWHQAQDLRWELENFTGDAKTIELVEKLDGEWDVVNPAQVLEKRIAPEKYEAAAGEANPAGTLERKDAGTLVAKVSVPANRRVVLTLTARRLNRH